MAIGGIVTAIVFGALIGVLGRLVMPGRRRMSIWLTVLVGVIAAIIGTWLGHAVFGWGRTFPFPVVLLQILLAAVGVFAVTALWSHRGV
ncbi:GlsB/YeaQ/YmgE family stress response membrane protein [Thermomonospora catenispora]|mgnify:CR=1 FL=1|uniref:GlsB/YeaQ/YmgE family stress response membrane protein n=1 Tax=Thermomonospora catenispora TaxID=2493090 RepID=UPI001123BA61|nr:GlsB/YeaQ/YmgE family stress response membrane protein [Thermomonospora catenispora]TNY37406.1 GlsB/YeaQ/YmgE family stress response membrane protein [Thermomonospora catenispora]